MVQPFICETGCVGVGSRFAIGEVITIWCPCHFGSLLSGWKKSGVSHSFSGRWSAHRQRRECHSRTHCCTQLSWQCRPPRHVHSGQCHCWLRDKDCHGLDLPQCAPLGRMSVLRIWRHLDRAGKQDEEHWVIRVYIIARQHKSQSLVGHYSER